jgi:hypothetical protein
MTIKRILVPSTSPPIAHRSITPSIAKVNRVLASMSRPLYTDVGVAAPRGELLEEAPTERRS